MKHGDGKYLYLDKGQIYTGVWCNDIAKCGSMVDYHYETNRVPNKPDFPIPEVYMTCISCYYTFFFAVQAKRYQNSPTRSCSRFRTLKIQKEIILTSHA